MDISIIIGLVIALLIICATTVVNNLINKKHKTLKSRVTILSDIVWCAGKIDESIESVINSELDDETKRNLLHAKECLNYILDKVKSYETGGDFNYG